MTQIVEFDLATVLERIEQKIERVDQKLDRFIEITNQKFESVQKDLTDVKVEQAKSQGKIEVIQVLLFSLIGLVVTVLLKVFDFFPKT